MDNAGYDFHQSYVVTFYSCMDIKLNPSYYACIMPNPLKTHYAQIYAVIVGLGLATYHGF